MKFCDDCKWCSINYTATDYVCEKSSDDPFFYKCMHPTASKGARYDCRYCNNMRYEKCGKDALLFEMKNDRINIKCTEMELEDESKTHRNNKMKFRKKYCLFDVLLSLLVYTAILWILSCCEAMITKTFRILGIPFFSIMLILFFCASIWDINSEKRH